MFRGTVPAPPTNEDFMTWTTSRVCAVSEFQPAARPSPDLSRATAPATTSVTTPTVEIVVPVHNEERALPGCVETLHAHLRERMPFPWRITVANNASTDATVEVARRIAGELDGVGVVHLDRKGRGLALRTVWGASEADIVVYMDVDLSTGLDGLLPLIAPLASGHSDLAIGSRLAPGARTVRGPPPGVRLPLLQPSDPADPRGPVQRRAVRFQGRPYRGAPATAGQDQGRRLVLRHRTAAAGRAQRAAHPRGTGRLGGGRGHPRRRPVHRHRRPARAVAHGAAEVLGRGARPAAAPPRAAAEHPDAVLAPDSGRSRLTWETGCFVAVGIVSTLGQAVLYWLLRTWWSPAVANLASLLVLTVFNTEANRRLTFRWSRTGVRRAHLGAGGHCSCSATS
ncbi:hypothetical protein GCM10020295_01600 [Streptomyces cinereospinus]